MRVDTELVFCTIFREISDNRMNHLMDYLSQGHGTSGLYRDGGRISHEILCLHSPDVFPVWLGENGFDGCVACLVFVASEI